MNKILAPPSGRSLGYFCLAWAVVTSCGHFSVVPGPSCTGQSGTYIPLALVGILRVVDADALCFFYAESTASWSASPVWVSGGFWFRQLCADNTTLFRGQTSCPGFLLEAGLQLNLKKSISVDPVAGDLFQRCGTRLLSHESVGNLALLELQ